MFWQLGSSTGQQRGAGEGLGWSRGYSVSLDAPLHPPLSPSSRQAQPLRVIAGAVVGPSLRWARTFSVGYLADGGAGTATEQS